MASPRPAEQVLQHIPAYTQNPPAPVVSAGKPTFLDDEGAAVKSNCSNRFGAWPAACEEGFRSSWTQRPQVPHAHAHPHTHTQFVETEKEGKTKANKVKSVISVSTDAQNLFVSDPTLNLLQACFSNFCDPSDHESRSKPLGTPTNEPRHSTEIDAVSFHCSRTGGTRFPRDDSVTLQSLAADGEGLVINRSPNTTVRMHTFILPCNYELNGAVWRSCASVRNGIIWLLM